MNINNNVLISMHGNIGSGKSTLLENMKLKYKDNKKIIFIKEPVDEWNLIKDNEGITILEKFYNNKTKYAFSFQMMAYITRYIILNDALENNENCILITERSIYTDKLVFAKMLYDDNDIEEVHYKIYLQWFDTLSKKLVVNKIIYVDVEPEICKNRIIQRSRKGEEMIPIEYLKKCDLYHKLMLKKNENCICNNQLIIDGKINIFENKNYLENILETINNFINS